MGRLAKTPGVTNVIAEAITLPAGPTVARPVSPTNGTFRFNLTTNKLEIWNGVEWRLIGTEGKLNIVQDTFTGDGTTTTFGPMSYSITAGKEATVMVYVGNVHQNSSTAYSFNGTSNITFTSPPPLGHNIVILHGFDSTVAI